MLEKALRNQIPGKTGESPVPPAEIQLDPDSLVITPGEESTSPPEVDQPKKDERCFITISVVQPD